MDIAHLVDAIELAIGNTADVTTVEQIAIAILNQRPAALDETVADRAALNPNPRAVDSAGSQSADGHSAGSHSAGSHSASSHSAGSHSAGDYSAGDYSENTYSSVTLGISLLDCASQLPATVRARAYDKIRRVAARFADISNDTFREFGWPTPPLRLSVSPVRTFGNCSSVSEYVELAKVLDQAAVDVGISAISGYSIIDYSMLIDGQLSASDHHFIDAIPIVLASTSRLNSSVVLPAPGGPSSSAVVYRLAKAIVTMASQSTELDRLTLLSNALDKEATLLNYFCPIGLKGASVNVVPSIDWAATLLGPQTEFDLSSVFASAMQSALTLGRVGNQIERRSALGLSKASGMVVNSGSEENRIPNVLNGESGLTWSRAVDESNLLIPGTASTQDVIEKLTDFCVKATSLNQTMAGNLLVLN